MDAAEPSPTVEPTDASGRTGRLEIAAVIAGPAERFLMIIAGLPSALYLGWRLRAVRDPVRARV